MSFWGRTWAAVKNFFKSLSLFNIIFLPLSLVGVIVLSIVGHSDGLSIVYSIFFVLGCFALSNGLFFMPIIAMIAQIFYAFISYRSALYGEFILALLLTVMLIFSLVTWLLKRQKDSLNIKVDKISKIEWICLPFVCIAFGVGVYFMLGALSTKYLVLSTLSFVLCVLANYFNIRRSFWVFVAYILQSLVLVVIWLLPLLSGQAGGIESLPVAFVSFAAAVYDVYGIYNWIKLGKKQNQVDEKENFDGTSSTSR